VDGAEKRYAFFVDRLAAPNAQVRQTALLEIGRAPYRWIRTAGATVPRDDIHRALRNPALLDWAPLYLLMLAQGASVEEAAHLRQRLNRVATSRRAPAELAALATARVEVDGVRGVAWLQRHYFADAARRLEEVEAVATGLGAQGDAAPADVRSAIVAAYRTLVATHPELAGRVAMDLYRWQDWTLAEALADLRDPDGARDFGAEYARRLYVAAARSARPQ
jgi:hypothetical protein